MKSKFIASSGLLAGAGVVFLPLIAFAQQTLGGVLLVIGDLVANVLPILIALAVVVFVWGIISFVLAKEEEAKKQGRDKIIYGLLGLFVIFAMWGLIALIANTFGIGAGPGSGGITAPCIPGTLGC